MSQLGVGVMLSMLCGDNGSAEIVKSAIGKQIASLILRDDALRFVMSDGQRFLLYDAGQSCCERRYMSADGDTFEHLIGATLQSIEIRTAPSASEDEYGDHEVQFLVVITDRGEQVFSSHNEHNGYYGGFAIRAAAERDDGSVSP